MADVSSERVASHIPLPGGAVSELVTADHGMLATNLNFIPVIVHDCLVMFGDLQQFQ